MAYADKVKTGNDVRDIHDTLCRAMIAPTENGSTAA